MTRWIERGRSRLQEEEEEEEEGEDMYVEKRLWDKWSGSFFTLNWFSNGPAFYASAFYASALIPRYAPTPRP